MRASLTASAFPSITDSTAVAICCAVATRSSSVRSRPRPVSSTKWPSSIGPGAYSALNCVVYRQYVVPRPACHAWP